MNKLKEWTFIHHNVVYDTPGGSLPGYQDLYQDLKTNGHFLYNFGAEAYIAGDYGTSIRALEIAKTYHTSSNLYSYLGDTYLKIHNYKAAAGSYLTCTHMAPALLYPKHQVVELYLQMGDTSRAIKVAEAALAYPIKSGAFILIACYQL